MPQPAFIQVGSCLIILLYCIRSMLHPVCWRNDYLNWLVIAFIGWACLSMAWSINIYEGINAIFHWAGCMVLFFVAARTIKDVRSCRIIFMALALSGTGISLIGLFQYFFDFGYVPQVNPPAATFSNRNLAAQFISMILPICAIIALSAENRITRWFGIFSLLISAAYLMISQTRAGWLAGIVAFGFMFGLLIFWAEQKNKLILVSKKLAVVLIVGVLCIALGLFFTGTLSSFNSKIPDLLQHKVYIPKDGENQLVYQDTFSVRLALWRNSWEMIKDQPMIGVGLGNFRIVYPAYHQRVVKEQLFSETLQARHAHHDFIQITAELGFPGLTLFLGLCFYPLIRSILHLRQQTDIRLRYVSIGVIGGITGFIVNAQFGFPMQTSITPMLFFVYLGILSAIRRFSVPENSSSFYIAKPVGLLLCGIAVILGVALGWYNRNLIISSQYYRLALENEYSHNVDGALTYGLLSLKYYPHSAATLSLVGRAYSIAGDQQKAINHLQHALKLHPDDINAGLNIGIAFIQNGDTAQAVKAIEEVLKIKPDHSKAWGNLGLIHFQIGDYDRSLECFEQALVYSPKNYSYLIHIGALRAEKKRFYEAAEAYKTALSFHPEQLFLHRNLAVIYYQHLNQIAQAKQHMRIYIEKAPDDPISADFFRIINAP